MAHKDAQGRWVVVPGAEEGKKKGLGMGCVLALVAAGMVPMLGILAAIAIPNFVAMQLRSKRAEAPVTLDGIRTAELASHAEQGAFFSAPTCPPIDPGREQVAWDPAWPCVQAWQAVGWLPDGPTRCRYTAVALPEATTASGPGDFRLVAECDIDGDGNLARYEASREQMAAMASASNVY